MRRRDFLHAAGLAAGSLLLRRELTAATRAGARPNIVFILADDLGYADLGCYGQRAIRTPSIDRLAAEGTRFTRCYAGSTVCAPSRSVLMTGQHTGHTRVRANFGQVGGVGPQKRVPLEDEDVTVAEVLEDAGYATGITGKWGLGEPETSGVPTRQGFQEWFGYLNQRNAHSYYPPYLWRNEEKAILEGNEGGRKGVYTHDLFTDFALDFIRRHEDRPFFLYLAWCIPHGRYEVPSLDPYADREGWTPEERAFAAMVTRMDRDVGRIMERLARLGLDDRTIVFFTSDNGAARPWKGRFDSCASLRGRKGNLYEGGIRVPMIVRWPGRVPAGRVCHAPWYFADFLPTAAALAGARPPAGIDGIDVLPALLGGKQDPSDRFLYWEYYGGGIQQAARWRSWKALRTAEGAPLALYDLARDPAETRDVAGQHPELLARFEAFLASAHTPSPNWPRRRRRRKAKT